MGIFSSAKAKLAAQKLEEEQLYEWAAEEVAVNNIRPGLMAKALSETDGDETKAAARYIKLRVETMRAEIQISNFARDQASKTEQRTQASKAEKQVTPARSEEGRRQGPPTEDVEGANVIVALLGIILVVVLTVVGLIVAGAS